MDPLTMPSTNTSHEVALLGEISSDFTDHAAELRAYLIENYDRLHSRLMRHIGCPEQASDSLHDAWLKLGEINISSAVLRPEAYLYRVACNIATDQIRSQRPWQYTDETITELEQVADHMPGPESIVEFRSEINAVDQALRSLPKRYRDVLICLRFNEYSRKKVAERHDVSLRCVDSMLKKILTHCADRTGDISKGCAQSDVLATC